MIKELLPRHVGLILGLSVFTHVSHAAVFNIPDGDVAALKAAIAAANSNGQADVINLAANGIYTLTEPDNTSFGPGGLPVVNDEVAGLDLTINGNGATIGRSSAAGTPEFRILFINAGAGVNCDNLTIANGWLNNPTFPSDRGAGLFVGHTATLTLTNCVLRNHTALWGGGIYNSGGSLVLNGGTFSDNVARIGGGIYTFEGAVTGSGTTFSTNIAQAGATLSAPGYGGAIFNKSGNLNVSSTLTGCQFVGNAIIGEWGGGGAIYHQKENGTAKLTLIDCTFDTNSAEKVEGGAIASFNAEVTVTGGTLRKNFARYGGAMHQWGGQVEVQSATFEENMAVMAPSTAGGTAGAIITLDNGVLILNASTLRGNEADYAGGALFNGGTASLTNCELTENVAGQDGGAIRNTGQLTLSDTSVIANDAGFGGGICTSSNATLQRCPIVGNDALYGGGIFNSGTLTIESSTLDNNRSTHPNGQGGAIATQINNNTPPETTVRNSTISHNQAVRGAGAHNVGSLTLVNSTLTGNIASQQGGAIYNSASTTLLSATFFGNSAVGAGGGVYNVQGTTTASVALGNSVFQHGANGANLVNNGGSFSSSGYNLSSDAAGGDATTGPGGLLNGSHDLRNTSPNLGPLQQNGGPTRTHRPMFPSPAIDSGDDEIVFPPLSLTTDQRGAGFARWLGTHVDRGALESGLGLRVTTTADHDDGSCTANDCTLREAITGVNSVGTGNISFGSTVTGTIELNSELPNIAGNLVLDGPGANLLAVRRNAGGDYRIFRIGNGTVNGPSVSIKGLTITNGRAGALMSPNDSGGGILNDRSSLYLVECTVIGNSAPAFETSWGGGIFNYNGALAVERCTITGNTAHDGGGIGSMITNGARRSIDVRTSTISGNTAQGGNGGGINSQGFNTGSMAELVLANCTLSGNSATAMGFFGGAGGAIFNGGFNSGEARLLLEDCTLALNSAPNTGGIYNSNDFTAANARLTLRNTLLKNGAMGGNIINWNGEVISLGRNLSDDGAGDASNTATTPGGYLNGSGDIRNTDPQLGPLQNNGGLTQTHALLDGSPAINAGAESGYSLSDQRGFLRKGTNDIGAFESNGIELRVLSISRAGEDVVVTFEGAKDFTYRLGRKLALPNATWENVKDVVASSDGPNEAIHMNGAALGRAFYRVELFLP